MRKVAALLFFIASFLSSAISAQQASVHVVRDVDFIANADYAENRDKLDLYLPEARQRFPVVISIYGGALTAGEKSKHAYVGQRFAAAGFGTAVINYRLSPAVSHPESTTVRVRLRSKAAMSVPKSTAPPLVASSARGRLDRSGFVRLITA